MSGCASDPCIAFSCCDISREQIQEENSDHISFTFCPLSIDRIHPLRSHTLECLSYIHRTCYSARMMIPSLCSDCRSLACHTLSDQAKISYGIIFPHRMYRDDCSEVV
jgi:hypothetical protein